MAAVSDEEQDELPDHEEPSVNDDKEDKDDPKKAGGGPMMNGFRDFLLKQELVKALVDCGFENPSEVQHECIPQAILGSDLLCQAKSGMGKTAVFVLGCLQLIDTKEKQLKVLVTCHSRELAHQITTEFERFGKQFAEIPVIHAVYGGIPIAQDKEKLAAKPPQILVGTLGRLCRLLYDKALDLSTVGHFVVDECDKIIDTLDMRRDMQKIFVSMPRKKQTMMFSATTSEEIRNQCKKFMVDPFVIVVDEAKLTLNGLQQFYTTTEENRKINKIVDVLDTLEFNQVIVYTGTVKRAEALNHVLDLAKFPTMAITSLLSQAERIARFQQFKDFKKRVLVTTDLFGRGIDIEKVNIVINFDMPKDSNCYLHRVGRAGRFGTKGLAITFAASDNDTEILNEVQKRFEVALREAPPLDQIDTNTYMNA